MHSELSQAIFYITDPVVFASLAHSTDNRPDSHPCLRFHSENHDGTLIITACAPGVRDMHFDSAMPRKSLTLVIARKWVVVTERRLGWINYAACAAIPIKQYGFLGSLVVAHDGMKG